MGRLTPLSKRWHWLWIAGVLKRSRASFSTWVLSALGKAFPKTATSTSMCAYFGPSLALKIFGKAFPRAFLNSVHRTPSGRLFQKFAEPWMAEQKRHMDVPQERFLEEPT